MMLFGVMYHGHAPVSCDIELDNDAIKYKWLINHEMPFSHFRSEWFGIKTKNGKQFFYPCGKNKSKNCFIITESKDIIQIPLQAFEDAMEEEKLFEY